jgi:hypothetical protein
MRKHILAHLFAATALEPESTSMCSALGLPAPQYSSGGGGSANGAPAGTIRLDTTVVVLLKDGCTDAGLALISHPFTAAQLQQAYLDGDVSSAVLAAAGVALPAAKPVKDEIVVSPAAPPQTQTVSGKNDDSNTVVKGNPVSVDVPKGRAVRAMVFGPRFINGSVLPAVAPHFVRCELDASPTISANSDGSERWTYATQWLFLGNPTGAGTAMGAVPAGAYDATVRFEIYKP